MLDIPNIILGGGGGGWTVDAGSKPTYEEKIEFPPPPRTLLWDFAKKNMEIWSWDVSTDCDDRVVMGTSDGEQWLEHFRIRQQTLVDSRDWPHVIIISLWLEIYCPASQEWQFYKGIKDLESIDHLCINPIRRIGLILKWSIDSH